MTNELFALAGLVGQPARCGPLRSVTGDRYRSPPGVIAPHLGRTGVHRGRARRGISPGPHAEARSPCGGRLAAERGPEHRHPSVHGVSSHGLSLLHGPFRHVWH